MFNQFSNYELSRIATVTEANNYMYKQGNNATLFLFTYPDDDMPSFVLTKHNEAFTLRQFDSDGTTNIVLENMTLLEEIISNFEFIINY